MGPTTTKLAEIFSEVLANLAFMCIDDEPADPTPGALWSEASIGYDGPFKGTLKLWCTSEFQALLAANLLAVEPGTPESEAAAEDAVKEFMNIVCGQYVTACYGTNDVYNLTIPKVKRLEFSPDWSQDGGEDVHHFNVEQFQVRIMHIPN